MLHQFERNTFSLCSVELSQGEEFSCCFIAHLRGNILINNSEKQFYIFYVVSLYLLWITIQIIL